LVDKTRLLGAEEGVSMYSWAWREGIIVKMDLGRE
jgi:hypothetical protein